MVVDGAAAATAIETRIAAPLQMTATSAASGILRLAEMRMAQLIGEMTVQVGLDPRDYVLVGFGGAGPLFTAMLAREIEAKGAIIPTYPAVWSAFGGLFADIVHDYSRSYIAELGGLDIAKFNDMAKELVSLSLLDLERDGVDQADAERSFALDIRYQGQSHELTVPLQGAIPFDQNSILKAGRLFDELHERTYSHRRDDPHLLVTIRLMSRARRKLALPSVDMPSTCSNEPARRRQIHLYGYDEPVEARVFVRGQLAPGFSVVGPAIVEEPQSSTFLPPDMKLRVGQSGELLIERR
jgi:N-methylhydantoinase A